ncbi:zinc-dependent alcohol dehydrogenase [Horticoccus sp. 23ND18S-11]|uniref:zinc-dependent alcohol dehydrogenase n=1 Tax=Horticoccus sp. 23ND18S-11 TaxID=3391832 RepID=UPI0039C9F4DC
MKALLLSAPSTLDYVEFPDPTPAADEVVVQVHACGICGSDIHGWDGSTGRRRPPLIMGHEAAGEVVSTGPRVTAWKAGDRVTFDSTISCGACRFCRDGQVNLCENRRVVGVAPVEYRQHGAFAERLALPDRILYRLPDTLPFAEAAMVEPVSIAVHAVQRTRIAPGSTAVVVGSGMIGLLVIQALRWAGAKNVVAVDLADNRLALARQLGATHTINSGTSDAAAEVARITEGLGADTAFEVVGFTATLNLALAVLKRGGACVLVGNLSPKTQDFPLQAVVTKEITVVGSCASAGEYPLCLDLIARGVINVKPMIETVAPLADGAAWFAKLSAKDGGRYMKVILQP